LKGLRRTEAIALGQRLVDQALGEFKLSLDEISPESLKAAIGELGMKDPDDLYEKVGMGERVAQLIARRLLPTALTAGGGNVPTPLAIAGTEGLLVSYARCCFPIPYDPIVAYLSTGRGVVVHRDNCVNVEDYRKHPEKWLPISWQTTAERTFSSQVHIDVLNRAGVLAAVASAIASTDTNIDHVSLNQGEGNTQLLVFELRIRDRKHLARIIRMIRRMPDVQRIHRFLSAHSR
jgi:GTP diphosphokinase / guanosine-3',5'-bis(diphosphate) 3'-diphosphatase